MAILLSIGCAIGMSDRASMVDGRDGWWGAISPTPETRAGEPETAAKESGKQESKHSEVASPLATVGGAKSDMEGIRCGWSDSYSSGSPEAEAWAWSRVTFCLSL
jgi:hypothetical protein